MGIWGVRQCQLIKNLNQIISKSEGRKERKKEMQEGKIPQIYLEFSFVIHVKEINLLNLIKETLLVAITQVWTIMILFYFFAKSTGFNYMHAFMCLKDVF